MAGLKYRWKISPKKSYSCSLIAAPRCSDAHLNCAPEPSAEHEFGEDVPPYAMSSAVSWASMLRRVNQSA